jgi:two-component system response regulator
VELRKPVILIVDDDPNDRFLMQSAFSNIGVNEAVYTVGDGAEAIEYLKGIGQYADRNRFQFPNLLLLDLKMARMHGFEFLRYIRQRPNLMVIPTIVFTSSEDLEDLKTAYVLGGEFLFGQSPDVRWALRPIQIYLRLLDARESSAH